VNICIKCVVCVFCTLALQPQLVPLLGKLVDQQESIYQLLANLEQKVQLLCCYRLTKLYRI